MSGWNTIKTIRRLEERADKLEMKFTNNHHDDIYGETIALVPKDSDALPQAPESVGSNWTSLVPMVLIFAVFYFLLIRPQEKRRRAQQDVVSGVKKGEEVLTNSGIIGIVSKINDSDNTVLLSIVF